MKATQTAQEYYDMQINDRLSIVWSFFKVPVNLFEISLSLTVQTLTSEPKVFNGTKYADFEEMSIKNK